MSRLSARRPPGTAPGDLLDARDQQLAAIVGAPECAGGEQDDGAWNVFVGNGQSLVLGTTSAKLITRRMPMIPTRLTIAFRAGTSTSDLSPSLSGGSVGGLHRFPPGNAGSGAQRARADAVGRGHGRAMRSTARAWISTATWAATCSRWARWRCLPERSNSGGSEPGGDAASDVGALTAGDYLMEYNGAAWSMRRADTGAAVTLSGAGTVASPFVADGLSIVVRRRGLRRVTASWSGPRPVPPLGISVLVTDPARVAAAAPIRSNAAVSNTGYRHHFFR